MKRPHELHHYCCVILLVGLLPPGIHAAPKAIMPEKHIDMLETYCFDCHDAATKKGKVDMESLSFEITKDIPTAEIWDDILASINAGEMPPKKKKQIPSHLKADFLKDLSIQMVNARNILSDSGGEITMRRLNRREYQNTLENLLGFKPIVDDLPDDTGVGGFDTAGASLYMSSDQLELYRESAKRALTYALKPKPSPKKQRIEAESTLKRPLYDKVKSVKAGKAKLLKKKTLSRREKNHLKTHQWRLDIADYYWLSRPETKTGVVLNPGGINFGLYVKLNHKPIFAGGTYRLKVRAGAYHDRPLRERYLKVGIQNGAHSYQNLAQFARVNGTVKNPEILTFELTVPPLGSKRVAFPITQRAYYDSSEQSYLYHQWKEKNGLGIPPGIWVDYFEVEGPYFSDRINWLANLIKSCEDRSEEKYARKLFSRFAKEAFRQKQPTPTYLSKMVNYYQAQRKLGASKQSATIECLSLILSSPSFLYMAEPRKGGNQSAPQKLNDRELAIRLAYFLSSAPPDDTLKSLARQKRLSHPKTLERETDRLLKRPQINEMISGFVHQWLDMKRIDMFEFQAKYHPRFDQQVRYSARREIYATFKYLLDHNLPIDKLLNSDFIVINDVLADHYQIDAPSCDETFRRVALPEDSPRGGLLGMAATHIMGSDGKRSSPVERGAWVLRHLLNDPPPPAPANVPMIAHDDKVEPARKLLSLHQEQPQCAQCHQKIDPIGYGLEHFAPSGLWRDQEPVEIGQAKHRHAAPKFKHFAIDPSGKLPRGESFQNYQQMRSLIASNYAEDFARGFTEHLIAYGLGRPYGISDHNLATDIRNKAKAQGNTPAAYIHALIQSQPFQMK